MKITKQWLKDKNACGEGVRWFLKQKDSEGIDVVKKLIKEDKLDWAKWTIVRLMDYKGSVSYAVFAAEQVIDIFEKEYPEDNRPRKAIEAAKRCIKDPSKENKASAADASYAAYAFAASTASYADDAANAAATSAANAATSTASAADAAYVAADAAYAYAYAANAAYAAANAYTSAAANAYTSAAAEKEMRLKILTYGIKLLEEK